MYELHGWFSLSPSADAEDYDESDVRRELEAVRPLVNALADAESVDARLLVLNGTDVVTVHGAPNRWRPELAALDTLLDHISRRLPGSYGVLYESSDEGDLPDRNAFVVRVMTRGRVVRQPDMLLSPRVPVIED